MSKKIICRFTSNNGIPGQLRPIEDVTVLATSYNVTLIGSSIIETNSYYMRTPRVENDFLACIQTAEGVYIAICAEGIRDDTINAYDITRYKPVEHLFSQESNVLTITKANKDYVEINLDPSTKDFRENVKKIFEYINYRSKDGLNFVHVPKQHITINGARSIR